MAGICKGYDLTFDYVLYEMSYSNAILYSSVLPSYNPDKDETESKYDPKKDANNPNLFQNVGEQIIKKR